MRYESSRCWNVYVGTVFEVFVEHEILDLHDEEWSELEIVRMASSLSWSVETVSRLIIYVEQPL